VCDTVAILAKGRVLKEGTMAEVVPEGRNLEDVFVELVQATSPQHEQLPSFITDKDNP
jgi:ABC-type Na+ transport system ATPase subunit NatA